MKNHKGHTITKILTLILSIGLLFAAVGCTAPVDNSVPVTGLTIASAGDATTITTHEGTLQLSVTVAPTGATNKLVTWSVTDGTGSATISESGLLTAVSNGTVTVKVTSQSVVTVTAEKVITISNQVILDATSPDRINLGTAEDYAILSKTGIATTGTTSVIGNIGISPASASYVTGFGLIMDSGNTFSTSSLVTGQIFASDYAVGTPALLTTAMSDVMIAYNDGAGRTADYTELYTGDLSGKTLSTGVYMWSNNVLINTDLTLDGNATDVFIFQIAGSLTMAANVKITLTGGVLPENIFWVVADTVAIDVGSDFQGVILAMTNVSMNTGSTIQGMIYAQSSVSLDATAVTKP